MSEANAAPDRSPRAVPAWWRAQAARFGSREALVNSDVRLRYAEADGESARLARGLLAAGVGKGTRVGLLLPNRPFWLVAWLAVTRIGAVAVPINTFFKARELGWMLRHSDVALLLCSSRFLSHDYLACLEQIAPGLPACTAGALRLPELPYLRSVIFGGNGTFEGNGEDPRGGKSEDEGRGEDPSEGKGEDPSGGGRPWAGSLASLLRGAESVDETLLRAVEAEVTPADPAVLLYSSGSTAEPKGAIHSHGSLLDQSAELAARRGLVPEDRIWSPMPYFWVGGLVFALLSTLQAGACAISEDVFDPERTLALLESERASIAIGWPHFGKALADHPSRAARDLSALRAGNLPGILPPERVPADPALRATALGMTETCGPHTWGGEGGLPVHLRGSFGRAFGGNEHRVVDPESRAVLPPGEAGEICVRGPRLLQGMVKREREQVFDRDGFYATGDAGFFDAEGVLYFQGRLGDMIKTGGANVSPGEVEAILLAQPELKAAQVVGLPDPERGQVVAAALVLEAGASLSAAELQTRLAKELSAYKVPRRLAFLASEAELPVTDSGKIDKARLRALLEARA